MSEFDPEKEKKYNEAQSEIERLQDEISRDMGVSPSDLPETKEELEQMESNSGADIENDPENYETLEVEEIGTIDETIEMKEHGQGVKSIQQEVSLDADGEMIVKDRDLQPEPVNIKENVKEDRKRQNKRSFRQTMALVVVGCLLGGLAIGAGIGVVNQVVPKYFMEEEKEPKEKFTFENTKNEKPEFKEGTFSREGYADLIDQVEPSVVNINSYLGDVSGYSFFDIPEEEIAGSGSGILFHEEDGLFFIATNAHVISGANNVDVSVAGSEPVTAKLVGKDASADLAVISIEKAALEEVGIHSVTLATFGDSDTMRVGDFVLAIGNSMGEGNSVTDGLISAKDKVIETKAEGQAESATLDVIQTNAAINRGNSGGPLINLDGEVIGINTAKMAEQGNFIAGDPTIEGMGYAIPSNKAKEIVEGLMDGEVKPSLGVVVSNMTEEIAKQYNLPQAGAIVQDVTEGSAAAEAGIERMDIITGFEEKSIMSVDQLLDAIAEKEVGDQVDIKIIRDGEPKTLKVTLKERPGNQF